MKSAKNVPSVIAFPRIDGPGGAFGRPPANSMRRPIRRPSRRSCPMRTPAYGPCVNEADRREREAKQLRRLAEVLQFDARRKAAFVALRPEGREDDRPVAGGAVGRPDRQRRSRRRRLRPRGRSPGQASPRRRFRRDADAGARLKALDEHLFKKLGFHGSRTDFYNRSNSYPERSHRRPRRNPDHVGRAVYRAGAAIGRECRGNRTAGTVPGAGSHRCRTTRR